MSATDTTPTRPDLGAELFAPSTGALQDAVGLPPDFYTSTWAYELEKERIFRREWLYVGRESDIREPGDYIATTVVDEPIIVVRAEDGAINAFSAVCRHRAMVIAEGNGHCKRLFRCPYHSWSFDFEGRLKGVPGMAGRDIDRAALSMPRFHAAAWHGFVFVNFADDPTPLAEQMAAVEPLVAHHDLANLVAVRGKDAELAVNWKTMAENNAECYHCEHLHHDTHKVAPTRNVIPNMTPEGSPILVTRTRTIHQDAFFSPSWKPYFPVIPTLREEERNHFTWIQVLPTFMISLYHDQVGFWAIQPTGPASISLQVGRLFPASTVERPDFEELHERIKRETSQLWDEDSFATLGVQKGRRSKFVNRGPYAELDEGVVALNRWLIERYEGAGVDTAGARAGEAGGTACA